MTATSTAAYAAAKTVANTATKSAARIASAFIFDRRDARRAGKGAMRLARFAADRIFALETCRLPLSQLAELARRELRSGRNPGPAFLDTLALASIAAQRTLGLRPHLAQLAAAVLVLQGRAAELASGEGKTLALALAAAVRSLDGTPVHLVLPDGVPAQPKAGVMRPFFESLGLSVGVVSADDDPSARREAYQADVCYAGAGELMSDSLRDRREAELVGFRQPESVIALIDDIDAVLIDAAEAQRGSAGAPAAPARPGLPRITAQVYFRRYCGLGGLSATLVEARGEMAAVYGLQVTSIASIYPCFRRYLGMKVLGSAAEWQRAVVARVQQLASTRRPVLVAARSPSAAGDLVAALREAGVDAALAAPGSAGAAGNAGGAGTMGAVGRVTVCSHPEASLHPVVLDPLARAAGGLAVLATYVAESRRAGRRLGHLTGRNGQPGSIETIAALPLPGLLALLPEPLMRSLARTRQFLREKHAERSRRQRARQSSLPQRTDPASAPRQPSHLQHQGR